MSRSAPCKNNCESVAFKRTIARLEKKIEELESSDQVMMPVEPTEDQLDAMYEAITYQNKVNSVCFELTPKQTLKANYKAMIRSIKGEG